MCSVLTNTPEWSFSHTTGGHLEELDPLPNEDISVTDENVSHNSQNTNNEFIAINVTNEHGQKLKPNEQNG